MLLKKGFTIVELLIVIVVIGILAAIVLNSFSDTQAKANNTQTTDALSKYSKGIQTFAADNGTYPIASYPCLGTPANNKCANTIDGTGACFGHGSAGYNATFANTMRQYMGATLATPSDQQLSCGGKTYAGGWYYSNDGKSAQMVGYFKGDIGCPPVGGLRTPSRSMTDNVTMCNYNFPTLP